MFRVRYCVLSVSQTQTRPLPRRGDCFSQSLAYSMNNSPHILQAASVAAQHGLARALTDSGLMASSETSTLATICSCLSTLSPPPSCSARVGTWVLRPELRLGRRATHKCNTTADSAKCFRACQVVFWRGSWCSLWKLSRTPAGSTCHPAHASAQREAERRQKQREDRSREKQGRDGGAQWGEGGGVGLEGG